MSLPLAFGHPDQFARKVLDDPRLRQRLSPNESSRLEASTKATNFPIHEVFPVLARRADEYLETIGKNSVLVEKAGLTLTLGSDQAAGYGTRRVFFTAARPSRPPSPPIPISGAGRLATME